MQNLVNLAIHLVVEICGLPNEVAFATKCLLPGNLAPAFLLLERRIENMVAVARPYAVIFLLILVRFALF